MKRLVVLLVAASMAPPSPALAWGYEGHEIVADIARAELTLAVRAKVDALLATDTDPLTGHDMASEATWAAAYRGHGHRETAAWHFVDTEIDGSADQDAACFGHPAPDRAASAGPAQDCVVDKVREFAAELAAPGTSPTERLLALCVEVERHAELLDGRRIGRGAQRAEKQVDPPPRPVVCRARERRGAP